MEEIKVDQLRGYIGEHTAYHHGDKSLNETIISMNHNYVGSNNINLLEPCGQLGCLDPDTPVLLWSGEIKAAKDITVYDKLVGDDGLVRNIHEVVSGVDEMYEIVSGKSKYKVNKEHILTLYDRASGEIVDIKVLDYLARQDKMNLMGLKNSSCIMWPEVTKDENMYSYGKIFGDDYPKLSNSRIPVSCVITSKTQRLELLAGLIDSSNGSVKYNRGVPFIEFHRVEIFGEVCFLCNSLGFKTHTSILVLTISGNNLDEIPMRNRKIHSKYECIENEYLEEIEVVCVGTGNYNGFYIDGNERFLLGDFTVTHNTRLSGGKDAASARYISTRLNPLTSLIFNRDDDDLLEYQDDDGTPIEPKYFWPCIPMILVNGVSGIGTGYSTDIPNYNPLEIIKILKNLIDDPNYAIPKLVPWYKNFKGRIVYNEKKDNYYSTGTWNRLDRTTLEIKELPIGVWTSNYKTFLDTLEEDTNNNITDVKNLGTETQVHFQIKSQTVQIDNWISDNLDLFKLHSVLKLNITLFDEKGIITTYNSVEEVLYKFYGIRNELYKKRYSYLTDLYEAEIREISGKVMFITKIMGNELEIFRVSKEEVIKQLEEQKFSKIGGSYDYLLNLKIYSFTKEQISKLEKELKDKLEKLDAHKAKKYTDLWKEDLCNLEKELSKDKTFL